MARGVGTIGASTDESRGASARTVTSAVYQTVSIRHLAYVSEPDDIKLKMLSHACVFSRVHLLYTVKVALVLNDHVGALCAGARARRATRRSAAQLNFSTHPVVVCREDRCIGHKLNLPTVRSESCRALPAMAKC